MIPRIEFICVLDARQSLSWSKEEASTLSQGIDQYCCCCCCCPKCSTLPRRGRRCFARPLATCGGDITFPSQEPLGFLRIDNDWMTGTTPSEFGQLLSLTFLVMEYNQLRGTIPREVSHFPSLEYFDFAYSSTGTIPTEHDQLVLGHPFTSTRCN